MLMSFYGMRIKLIIFCLYTIELNHPLDIPLPTTTKTKSVNEIPAENKTDLQLK